MGRHDTCAEDELSRAASGAWRTGQLPLVRQEEQSARTKIGHRGDCSWDTAIHEAMLVAACSREYESKSRRGRSNALVFANSATGADRERTHPTGSKTLAGSPAAASTRAVTTSSRSALSQQAFMCRCPATVNDVNERAF
jgi:hypothetical protein